jgi:hypothetical protein
MVKGTSVAEHKHCASKVNRERGSEVLNLSSGTSEERVHGYNWTGTRIIQDVMLKKI